MSRYVFGTHEEAQSFYKVAKGKIAKGKIEVVGRGAEDLKWHSEDDVLVNIGYCSANKVMPGTIVEPSYVANARTREIIRIVPVFPVENRMCISSEEFITEPLVEYSAVYDMELFKIAANHFGKVHALKIVSDNLNEKERAKFNGEEQWAKVVELICRCLKD